MKIAVKTYSSPVADLTLASLNNKMIRLEINYTRNKLQQELAEQNETTSFTTDSKAIDNCMLWLDRYFSKQNPIEYPPFALSGTKFQKKVWQKLASIPFGTVITYGELAKSIGCKSARPIGGAVGKNPLTILLPCHRVISANMQLGGFSCGTKFKIKLLEHEGFKLDPLSKKLYKY